MTGFIKIKDDKIKDFYHINEHGVIINSVRGITLSSSIDKRGKGYKKVVLYSKKGHRLNLFVHRLVACTFIDNPHDKPTVNHKNGVTTDNYVNNLEWCTISENTKHAYNLGLSGGERHGMSKLKEKDVIKIFRMRSSGISVHEISKKYKVSHSCVYRIINKKYWKNLNFF